MTSSLLGSENSMDRPRCLSPVCAPHGSKLITATTTRPQQIRRLESLKLILRYNPTSGSRVRQSSNIARVSHLGADAARGGGDEIQHCSGGRAGEGLLCVGYRRSQVAPPAEQRVVKPPQLQP